jgi:hypothetical protein
VVGIAVGVVVGVVVAVGVGVVNDINHAGGGH